MVKKINKFFNIYSNVEDSFILIEQNSKFYDLPGIYMIKNIITEDVYIGQSNSVGYRLTSHRSALRSNKHMYQNNNFDLLQKSWNKYGESNFKCYLVEVCDLGKLDEREVYWIKYFNCNRRKSGKGFNLTDGGNRPPLGTFNKGRVHITNGEITKSVKPEQLNYYFSLGFVRGISNSKESAKKRWETRVLNGNTESGMKGKKHSEEWRRRQSECIKGRKKIFLGLQEKYIPAEDLQEFLDLGWKVGVSPYREQPNRDKFYYHNKGKHMSEELKRKLIESKEKPIVQYDSHGNFLGEYKSIKHASEELNIPYRYLWKAVRNKKRSLKRYNCIFMYKTESWINEDEKS